MTQCERIVKYCNDFGSITALEAVQKLGILQLGARIYELEHNGIFFNREHESSKNRYGEKVYYVRYSLKKVMFQKETTVL